jgi:recombinational DNA repair protein RecR
MFVVNDLLDAYSYIIARSESGYQLTFMLRDGRQVIVAVEPTGDTALLAQRIAERLRESGNRLLRLGLGPATQVYEGWMMD